jgi:flagellin-specific chaperone FliS
MLETRYSTLERDNGSGIRDQGFPTLPFGTLTSVGIGDPARSESSYSKHPASANAVRSYQQNRVATADPLKLILMVYDRAIAGCHHQDLEIAGRAITELINGLNMDAGTISENLLAIYQYCGEAIRKGQYDEAASILKDLRDTWAAVANGSIGL